MRVLALLHDSDLLANLPLRFTDSLCEGSVARERHLRLASKLIQLVQTGICPFHDLHGLDWRERPERNEARGGIYVTYDLLVIIPGVFTEPDLTVLTLAYLPANPVLIYHPHVTLTNGVYLVSDSNRNGVPNRISRVSHGCCVRGIEFGEETAWLYTREIDERNRFGERRSNGRLASRSGSSREVQRGCEGWKERG